MMLYTFALLSVGRCLATNKSFIDKLPATRGVCVCVCMCVCACVLRDHRIGK